MNMQTLERAYSLVRSGVTLLTESDVSGMRAVSDEELAQAEIVPAELLKYLVPGSGKLQDQPGDETRLGGEFQLKFRTGDVTDGTEDLETTYDYIEKMVKQQLPQSQDVPGGVYFHSYANVDPSLSDDQQIIVKCMVIGGRDI